MKVVIIGAGIGGLTLAIGLKQKGFIGQIELYERDESAFSRPQGYALGLKGDGGLPVLQELGLKEKVLDEDAVKVTNFVFTDQRGSELLSLASQDERHQTYRVQRQHLKQALLNAAKDAPIYYNKTCRGYEQTEKGITVLFSDGTKAEADYVIASDGVASAIRQQMVGDDKHYLGLAAIVGFAPVEIKHSLLEGGYFMTLGDKGDSIFVYRQPGGVHFSYTSSVASEEELTSLSAPTLLKRVKSASENWHQLIKDIVDKTDESSLTVRGYYDKEPIQTVHDGNVWLIGDAAHPMCPFQGQGANMAMVDALRIATYLAALSKKSLSDETPDMLDTDIVKRGRKAVRESRGAAKQFHTSNTFMRFNRNFGFKMANIFIKLFSK